MSERQSEYDVVSFELNPGLLSLACALFPMFVGVAVDELPFVMGGRLRPYFGYILLAALGFTVAGLALGGWALRRPESRGAGRFGLLVNGVVLVLLALFLLIFRWVRWGQLSWF